MACISQSVQPLHPRKNQLQFLFLIQTGSMIFLQYLEKDFLKCER
nr:MAG TPA: hypothetical protein [Caudoviricetes sp.]